MIALAQLAGSHLSETLDRVDLQARFEDAEAVASFWELVSACDGVQARLLDHLNEETPTGELPPEHSYRLPFRVVLMKPVAPGRAYFLTRDGFRHFLTLKAIEELPSEILVAVDFISFRTGTTLVAPWGDTASQHDIPTVVGDAPRKLVRDLASDLVPRSATSWIVADDELPEGIIGEAFAIAAAQVLPLTLVGEAWQQDGVVHVAVRGDRTVTLVASPVETISSEDHRALNAAAAWVYGHPDVEVRHTLFANEIAREWHEGERWTGAKAARLEAVLRQAKIAYGHHLRAQSKDALKSLTDLRKAVGEEVEKAAGQTRELVALLWRDFAVAAGAIAIRLFTLANGSVATGYAASTLLFGTAFFVGYSFTISVWLNRRFHRHAKQLRKDWHKRLYGFLGREEFEQLAVRPLDEVRQSYRTARLLVALAYGAVIATLLVVAIQALPTDAPGSIAPASGQAVQSPSGANP